ncbi:MAG TPA: hypothetical protein VGY58_06685 [Gemmataceae bacterium]|jgi:hypothetical protein|nr:hypothetical protein [Gemmataceae bacterium]
MLSKPVLRDILDDEALTRGLADPEARILVEWLVETAEQVADDSLSDAATRQRVQALCRKGRAIGRFVDLWCHARTPGAAGQLAAAERFDWPLPTGAGDPCDIMQAILKWETEHSGKRSPN